jgi:hypothetical protein
MRLLLPTLAIAGVLATSLAAPCRADEEKKEEKKEEEGKKPEEQQEEKPGFTPFQLALFRPAQIFSAKRDVYGLRIDVLLGDNDHVYGLDVGIVNLSNESAGLAIGAVNFAEDGFAGLQLAALSNWVTSAGGMQGLQLAPLNFTGNAWGLQIGALNFVWELFGKGRARGFQIGALSYADVVIGAQLGAVGLADELDGLQLGVVNVASDSTGVQVGLVNWTTGTATGLQIGVLNYCRQMKGVQIGVVNVIRKGPVLLLPVVNASF